MPGTCHCKINFAESNKIVHSLSTDEWTNSVIEEINSKEPRKTEFSLKILYDLRDTDRIVEDAERCYLNILYDRYPGCKNRIYLASNKIDISY